MSVTEYSLTMFLFCNMHAKSQCTDACHAIAAVFHNVVLRKRIKIPRTCCKLTVVLNYRIPLINLGAMEMVLT